MKKDKKAFATRAIDAGEHLPSIMYGFYNKTHNGVQRHLCGRRAWVFGSAWALSFQLAFSERLNEP